MARPGSVQPTDGELEILNILWERGPSAFGEVVSGLRQQREVAPTTVATMLKVMLHKDLVKKTRGPRGYVWAAKVTQKKAATTMLRKLLDRVFEGSAQRLVAHLVEEGRLSPRDWKEIQRMLGRSK